MGTNNICYRIRCWCAKSIRKWIRTYVVVKMLFIVFILFIVIYCIYSFIKAAVSLYHSSTVFKLMEMTSAKGEVCGHVSCNHCPSVATLLINISWLDRLSRLRVNSVLIGSLFQPVDLLHLKLAEIVQSTAGSYYSWCERKMKVTTFQ